MGVFDNARWVALSQVTKITSQVIGMMVLARLVPPAEYGLMAMASVVTNFAMIFRDMGSSAAIIQRRVLTTEMKTTVFWFNIVVGVGIAIIVMVAAPIAVNVFHAPKLLGVLIILSIVFPLSSCSITHQALMERDSKFKVVAGVEIGSTLVGLAVAIVMGLGGKGVYSMVAQAVVTSFLSSVLLWWVSDWRPLNVNRTSWVDLKSILGFSGNLVGFNIVNYFSRNSDNVVIGHYFSSAVLGAYSLAYRVMLFPLQSLTFVVSRSMYPLLSQQQSDNASLRTTYFQVVAVISALVAPMMAGMVVLRTQFIASFLGNGWDLSSTLLLWLAPTGFIQSILSTTGVVFMAKGATRTLMWLGCVGALLQVGAFILGVRGGVELMVKLYFLANLINAIPVLKLCMKQMDSDLWSLSKVIYKPVVCALLMVVFLYSIRFAFPQDAGIFFFWVSVLGGGVFYFAVYSIIDRQNTIRLLSVIRH